MNLSVILDIVRGQTVSMHGYDCIVRSYDENGAVLEYPNGEVRYEYLDDIADQNEDLVLEEELIYGDDYDDDEW